jgi:hypothetical protein
VRERSFWKICAFVYMIAFVHSFRVLVDTLVVGHPCKRKRKRREARGAVFCSFDDAGLRGGGAGGGAYETRA